MNRNRHLSIKNYGKRHVQPHMPRYCETKKKKNKASKVRAKLKNIVKKVFRKKRG